MRRSAFIAFVAAEVAFGCAHRAPRQAEEASRTPKKSAEEVRGTKVQPPAAEGTLKVLPAIGLEGRVIFVNESLRYAVLNFPVGGLPPPGQRMRVVRHGQTVGEVQITPMRRDDSLVADMLWGEARVGDNVRLP